MKVLITITCLLILSKNYSQSEIEVKDYDGNLYETEDLGGILMTTSNLNVTHFNNGDEIFEVNSIKSLNEATKNKIPAYCHFKFDKSKTTLYNWYAVNDKRGLSPQGYELPSEDLISKLYYKLKENPNRKVFANLADGIVNPLDSFIFWENSVIYWAYDDCDKVNNSTARYFDASFKSACWLKNNYLPVRFVKILN